nr:disintegrin and metalloproteinase domain-containing protein 29-like [Pogona vitticeps]
MLGYGAGLLPLLLSLGFVGASKYLYSEVVVPKMLETQAGFISTKEVSYFIRIEGNNRIIHLHQKSFIFRNMPIYTFDPKGNRQEDHPYIKVDCYYSGSVEDTPDSDVSLSTCAGLWGFIQIGSLKYEIHPIENSRGFQHFIYRTDPEEQEPCRGRLEQQDELTSEDIQGRGAEEVLTRSPGWGLPGTVTEFPGPNAPSRYLEYFAVCDSSMFQREKQNVTRVIQTVLQMLLILHNIYDDVGLHVVLTGIEIWTRRDYLAVSETLDAFYNYASTELRHLVHFDHASLFMIMGEDHPFGKLWREHSCLENRLSVSAVQTSPSSTSDGVSAAHQLGHALGFAHDDLLAQRGRTCDCRCGSQPSHCLMHSSAAECHRLSNCSKNAYSAFLARQGKECFLNLPKDLSVARMCGNGLVESGEDCDCGTDEECQEDGCCLKDCRWKPGASCHYGVCCQHCEIANEGKLCREAATECDLTEYCTGNSATCPADVHKQDGMLCGTGDRCYLGKCLDRQQHCQVLFGKDAQPAPPSCYRGVNTRGDRTGNCGKAKPGYKKCQEEDVFCGRIQCVNVKEIPIISTRQGVIQTPIDNVLCLGTEFHEEEEAYDVGAIKDGSTCGTDKICVNRSCVSLTILNYDCDFSKCNNHGVCNSNRNCHCTYGWAPPDCRSRGFGGSLDSGPPPERVQSKKPLMLSSMVGVVLLLVTLSIMLRKHIYSWLRIGKERSVGVPEVVSEMDSAPENSELPKS